ncbi:SAM-dependent methyltransferase [Catenulispora sp. MAP5-51]|uniref:class I SAM-dependent methyltransferase n=1 Tax=Catenulispora sp. MAP5-51 TaxID=3156298 RepID=UPI003511D0FE
MTELSANTSRPPDGAAAPDAAPDRAPNRGPDWGVGRYEEIAPDLASAAGVVVDTAAIQPSERVLDLGCGTGNATLLAAAHSPHVIGVDPAARLREVAEARAKAAGDGTTRFLAGRAEELPLGDADVDVALSVFALIFAADPESAAAELSRVLAPHGRIILSAWIPSGTMFEYVSLVQQTIRRAIGAPAAPPPFRWEERGALTGLLARYGFSVHVTEHSLAFTHESPEAFHDNQSRHHPLAVAGMAALERTGQAADLHPQLLEILRAGNEDPEAFRMTSRYIVAEARR